GTYWVNTYALDTRPLYTLESLTFHEAVPGHHLQIALQQELTGLPEFRRFASEGAFVEGWALYAERLGREAGFDTGPCRDLGRLVHGSVQRLRPADLRDVARVPARRRYRHPRQGLEPHRGDGVPREQHGPVPARDRDRDRPLHLVAGAGPLLQDGGAEDPCAA